MSTSNTDPALVRQSNNVLESAGLEWLGFRLPGVRVETYFYYKLVEEGPYSVGIHGHEHWELTRLVSGRATYRIQTAHGDVEVEPDPGHYLLVPPGRPHRWDLTEATLLLNSWQVRLYPDDEVGEGLIALLARKSEECGFLMEALPVQVQAEQLLRELTQEKFYPSIIGPMASGVARIVIGGVFGSLRPWPQELCERENSFAPTSENLANRLKEFLEANLHHPITLVDLESHFHYSSRHLNRIFNQYFSASIGQYLRDRRFELATRWLVTTNRSIKDIALSLGYGNISHFCRYFRKRKHLSPTEYREMGSHKDNKNTFANSAPAGD